MNNLPEAQRRARQDPDDREAGAQLEHEIERLGYELCFHRDISLFNTPHDCPYEVDINENFSTWCFCCSECEHNCFMDT